MQFSINLDKIFKLYMKLLIVLMIFFAFILGCIDYNYIEPNEDYKPEIRGVDMSLLPELKNSGLTFFNQSDKPEDMLQTLKNAGVNVIRLRLWYDPAEPNSGFESVKTIAKEIQQKGLKVLLTVHYSDSWADPGKQTKPAKWKVLDFNTLKDSVYQYTKRIMKEINPEFIQIGNEINSGLLWPEGKIGNLTQMKQLISSGISAVRAANKSTEIIIHFAGTSSSDWFFSQLFDLDYDIIGLSYYPIWHGKDLDVLKNTLMNLSQKYGKKVIIAETSYPFTLSWNDATTNIIGSESQILAEFPATPIGQKNYLMKIKEIIKSIDKGAGFVYWGSEWVSYKGKDSKSGSTWENQAFWDFTNSALPAFDVYSK
jgi:arabinogalactan endo-1,4-beta-galactosidase